MPKRRASGEGNIRKRSDGRWEGRYVAGHDANGKPIRKSVLAHTQAEARDKLAAALAECRILDVTRADEYTVADWVQTWYEVYSKPNIRPSTADYYRRFIDRHILPALGSIKLKKLTGRHIQKLYNDLKSHGRVRASQKAKNPGLSPAYIRGLHQMLHNCLDRARRERLITYNPTEDCIVPKLQKTEMKILHPEHIKAYLDAAEKRDVLPMFYLELTSGLRKGELVALLWSDLDIESKTISVSKQATRPRRSTAELDQTASVGTAHTAPHDVYTETPPLQTQVTRPKTDTSIRRISIPQEAVDLLIAEHKKHPNNPYMFPSPKTGEMYHPDSVVKLHEKILKDANLEHIRFHDLRHTFATLALQSGVDVKTLSAMLGHFDAGFTLSTYAHATRKSQDDAAQKVGEFMLEKSA